jgi:hypothetical protein
MYKLKLLSIFVIFIFYSKINAQTIEFGQPIKVKSKINYTQIIGSNDQGSFLIRCRDNNFKKEVFIEKYNSKLALEIGKDMPLSIPAYVEKVLLIGQNIFVFVSAKNNNTNKIDFLVQKLDMNLNMIGSMVFLATIDEFILADNQSLLIRTSLNKKFFSLSFVAKTSQNNKEKSALYLFGFDQTLTQLFGKTFELNESLNNIETTNSDIDNNGNFCTLLDFPKSSSNRKQNHNRKFVMYVFYNATQTMLEYDIATPKIEIDDIGFTVNNIKKQINIFGFYAETEGASNKGYLFETIDLQSTSIKNNMLDTISLLNLKDKISFGKGLDLSDLYIRKIIPRSDGGIFLIAEKYFLTRQSYTYYVNGFPQTNTRTVFNYNDIMVLSINQDGFVDNGNILNKEQQSVSDGGYYSSICNFINNDAIYTIYNSDVNQEGDVLMNKFDVKGKSENKILVKAIKASLLIIPTDCKQISANSLLACTIRDKRFTLMRITF